MAIDRTGTRGPTRGQGAKPKGGGNLAERARRRAGRPRLTEPAPDLPLVEGLRFRMEAGLHDDLAATGFDPGSVADTFRAAFTLVWGRISLADRGRLISYWRDDPDNRALRARTPDPQPTPLIQVVHRPDLTSVELTAFGRVITFAAALVVGRHDNLEREIARALAGVDLLATRLHWGLILKLIDEPLDRWSRGAGAGATDEQRESKLDELEEAHLAAHDAQVAKIVAGWGVEPTA